MSPIDGAAAKTKIKTGTRFCMNEKNKDAPTICVVGLGYVGLPLAVELGKTFRTTGLDHDVNRINQLLSGKDETNEIDSENFKAASFLSLVSDPSDVPDAQIFIVTVPTPIDHFKTPDLRPLIAASKTVGSIMNKGSIVVYESTVYPGATEEVCVPVLEGASGLSLGHDFSVGYSPERINPGDPHHNVRTITKIISASDATSAQRIKDVYDQVVDAGTYLTSSIKVAEAAKVIENTQRDVNIGLINELAVIFDKLDIDTEEVLKAAETKWNFLPFRPGLVGGHCIGVDPYYLAYRAQREDLNPEMILAGRRINEGMTEFATNKVIKGMSKAGVRLSGSQVLILGFAFKENCPDYRNSKVVELIRGLKEYGVAVHCHDPWVNNEAASSIYDIEFVNLPQKDTYDAVVVAVAHDIFRSMGIAEIRGFVKPRGLVADLKYLFRQDEVDLRM